MTSSTTTGATGQSVIRTDLRDKLTGQAKYTADLKLPGPSPSGPHAPRWRGSRRESGPRC